MRHDVGPLLSILDAIIAVGGTTAFQMPMNADEFDDHLVSGPACFLCFTAQAAAGEIRKFQALARDPALLSGWGDIGTFTRRDNGRAGVGRALFAATAEAARTLGLVALNAIIRADNGLGVPYHDRMRFETCRIDPAVPLRDGTPVDRISERFLLR